MNWAGVWEEQQGISSVKCEKAHYGLHSVTISLRPMYWSYERLFQSGMMLKLYGEFAELWFFLMKTKGTYVSPPLLPPEWTNLWHFGFGLFKPGRLPDLTAFTSSEEWT